MWRVETRHDVYDGEGFGHTFTGFIEMETLSGEQAIIDELCRVYPGVRGKRVELRYVEAKRR